MEGSTVSVTMVNPVHWFEIPVGDLDRAVSFYQRVFGGDMQRQVVGVLKMAFFEWDHAAPGSTGALVEHEAYVPSYEGTMVYFSVEDIPSTLRRVVKAGGSVINEKTSIGEHGFVAHFEDSEGNRVALHARE